MIASSVLMSVGTGLITTWTVSTHLVELIVYPAIIGFAAGLGFLGPQSSVPNALLKADAPLGLAVVLFAQNFGPALCVTLAQAIFTNRLSAHLHQLAPNAASLENLGLTQIKVSFGGDHLAQILRGFSEALSQS